jgi:hypothetical protein
MLHTRAEIEKQHFRKKFTGRNGGFLQSSPDEKVQMKRIDKPNERSILKVHPMIIGRGWKNDK